MKKFLIISYFIGMIMFTYFSAKAVAIYKSGSTEITFRDLKRDMSNQEIVDRRITPPEEGKKVVERVRIRETRKKTLIGWETSIDTIAGPDTWYVNCSCN